MARRDGRPVLIAKDGAVPLVRLALDGTGDGGDYDEAFLQKFLFEHPDVLPLEEIEGAFESLVPVCREFPTKHGYVDNVFITAHGNIVIAEAKLWRNPEARRKVVAQALDYASCLFEMSYSEFETAVLRGEFGRPSKPVRLWDMVPEQDRLPEHEFVDAVSRNLRHGRIVVLVVGDGIRSEAERLAQSLQSHAGLRFTFALVELTLYSMPGTGTRLVVPRTLAKTKLVERGVVRIESGNVSVAPAPVTSDTSEGGARSIPGSISSDEFFDAMRALDAALPGRIQTFLEALAPLGIYPDFRRSLNLKWAAPNGRTANLAIIQRDSQVWTSEAGLALGEPFCREYNEALAALWGGRAERSGTSKWQVKVGGKIPRIEVVAATFDGWADLLGRLLPLAAERLAEVA